MGDENANAAETAEPEGPSADQILAEALRVPMPPPEPEDDEPAAPPTQEPSKDKAAKGKAKAEPSQPDKPKRRELDLGGQWKQARQTEEVARKKLQQAEAMMAEAQSIKERAAILDKFAGDPLTAFREAAKAAGQDPDKAVQALIERQVNAGQPGAAELLGVIDKAKGELKAEVEAIKAQRAEEQQAATQGYLERRYAELMSIQQSETLSDRWEHLGDMPPARFEHEMRQAIQWAAEARPDLLQNIVSFADMLDKAAGQEYAHTEQKKAQRRSKAGPPGSGNAGQRSRDADSRSGGTKSGAAARRTTLTPDDSAEGAGASRDTERARMKALEQTLEDQLFGGG